MRRFCTVIIFLLLVSFTSFSQGRKGSKGDVVKRMKAEKISFLAQELELTPKEAQDFWPVYNEFERLRFKVDLQRREIERKVNVGIDTLAIQEVDRLIDVYVNLSVKESRLLKTYNDKFKEVLPLTKILKLYHAEKKFREHMLREFRRKHFEGGKIKSQN